MTNRIARSLKFEDTKMVVRSHKQKTNRQHNGQMKNDKRTNNDLSSKVKVAILIRFMFMMSCQISHKYQGYVWLSNHIVVNNHYATLMHLS
jgi:hypothetical protein